MSRRASYYNQILHVLQHLHRLYPTYNMGRHLATALDGYGDVWGLTDRELTFALEKYVSELELDKSSPKTEEDRLRKILMDNAFSTNEDEEYGND